MANAIASERMHLKPSSPRNWFAAARAMRLRGDEVGALAADARSAELIRIASGGMHAASAP